MKTRQHIFILLILGLFFGSCKTKTEIHNSLNSLDWFGTYTGVLSPVDGKSRSFSLYVFDDNTYSMQSAETENPQHVTYSGGKITWNKEGNEMSLQDAVTKRLLTFRVQENRLVYIKENGKKVFDTGGMNVLNKISMEDITEKYWKLIEVGGKMITMDASMNREPHIILKRENHQVTGTTGCNSFSGIYEIGPGNRIVFSKMAATLMACINMDVERDLLNALEICDNYTISTDGNILSLNRGRMVPLARFEVVYLR
ncbi:MAG: META domain-containing protein [Candidatus Azobacteroides sp.]|nr:META domain-containing protein [Candidatus Azobacteroides sp.]